MEKACQVANPYNNIMVTWKNKEKEYLLSILNHIIISPVLFYQDNIEEDSLQKAKALIKCLLMEKVEAKLTDDLYSTIIFVQCRDAAIALAELLKHH
jgi:endoribonuclease Dicer